MGYVYHGSHNKGIKRLEPRKSTHGVYVYATTYKELATIFSGKCGDDLTYTIYRNDPSEPWILVERVPSGFDVMFNNGASIYTLDDSSFKDIHTGFSEVESEVGVDTLKEEEIENVYEELKKLDSDGKIKMYNYPNKPMDIPMDDSDLIEKEIEYCNRSNVPIKKELFNRLVYLHPNLINKVNDILSSLGFEMFTEMDIVNEFNYNIMRQMIDNKHERYLNSAYISITNCFPNLKQVLDEKMSIMNKDKNEQIDFIINNIPYINEIEKNNIRNRYINDERTISEIGNELFEEIKKMAIESNNIQR